MNSSPGVLDHRLKKVGADAVYHRFRHTFATRFLRAGGSYEDLAVLLGHADTRTTKIYGLVEETHVARRARGLEIDWFGNPEGQDEHGGEAVGKLGS